MVFLIHSFEFLITEVLIYFAQIQHFLHTLSLRTGNNFINLRGRDENTYYITNKQNVMYTHEYF